MVGTVVITDVIDVDVGVVEVVLAPVVELPLLIADGAFEGDVELDSAVVVEGVVVADGVVEDRKSVV